jgi:hypothetical protein
MNFHYYIFLCLLNILSWWIFRTLFRLSPKLHPHAKHTTVCVVCVFFFQREKRLILNLGIVHL